jgi:hypothetical protein
VTKSSLNRSSFLKVAASVKHFDHSSSEERSPEAEAAALKVG